MEMIPTSFYQLVFVLRSISEKQKNLKQNNNPCHALHSISPYIAITPLNCFSCSVLPVMYVGKRSVCSAPASSVSGAYFVQQVGEILKWEDSDA